MPGVRVGKDKGEDGGIKRRHVQRQHLLFLALITPNFLLLGVFTYWHDLPVLPVPSFASFNEGEQKVPQKHKPSFMRVKP
jgi:hypothetical protein